MSAHLRPIAPIRSSALGLALVALVLTSPGAAQDGDIDGTISRPVVQALPSRASYELNAALTRLAANPRDVNALIDAGNAAMALGDSEAAMGFLGRADQLSPGNPRVKATLASAAAFATTDFRPDLAAFKVPTLIIHGTADKTVPIDAAGRAAAKGIASATLIEYDGAPHGLFATEKDRLTQDMLDFIRR